MRDIGGELEKDGVCSGGYVSFALEVIGRLAARRQSGVGNLRNALLDRMLELVKSPLPDGAGQAIAEFRDARVPEDQIVDFYIPEAARVFGVDWLEDRASFAEVTIGVGRLQEMLTALQSDWSADAYDPLNDQAVLVVVPPGEQHTLGAFVLASMLRRKGISVCIQIAPGMSELSRLLAGRRFGAAMISLGSAERVEVTQKLVKTVKQLTRGQLPVAIGGAVLDVCRRSLDGAGAELLTNDLTTVISEFGLAGHSMTRHVG